MTTPFICARCLRASRQLTRAATPANRAYHASPAIASRAQTRLSERTKASTHTAAPQPRCLSTSAILRAPSLESQPTTSKTEPPPPASQTTTKASSSSSYTTRTLLNPRHDEETGAEMTIALTPRATKRLQQIMTKDKNPSLCLRVTVESGGCHGFQYLMSLVDMSKVDESEDVVFVGLEPDSAPLEMEESGTGEWRKVAEGRPKVVIDESSLELLQGSNVDYTMELIGSQFKIDNPRASSSCGCGTSFDVKI